MRGYFKNKKYCWMMAVFAIFTLVLSMLYTDTSVVSLAGLGLLGFVDLESMDEDQKKFIKGLDDKLEELNMKFLKDALPKSEYVKELTGLTEAMKDLNDNVLSDKIDKKDFDTFKENVLGELVKIKAVMEKTPDGGFKIKGLEDQVRDQLKSYISKDHNGREIVDLKSACKSMPGNKLNITIIPNVKANTPITSNVTTTGVPMSPGVVFDPSISTPPLAESELRQFANVATINARTIIYTQLKDSTGDAEWVPEGGLKPSMTASIEEKSITAGKVALTATVTDEVITDLPQLVAEIRSEIIYKIGVAEEEGILFGSGSNGEIKGVFSDIPEYSLTSLKVARPNNFDAIVAAYTQIVSTSKRNYTPNLVRVNPVDLANMKLTKDANGAYLFPPFTLQDGSLISGVQIKPSTTITEDEFFIGDFRYLNIRDYQPLSITFGWVNDDFQKNQVTMVGEKRLLAYIKSNYLTAFVKGKYSTIKEAIDANPVSDSPEVGS